VRAYAPSCSFKPRPRAPPPDPRLKPGPVFLASEGVINPLGESKAELAVLNPSSEASSGGGRREKRQSCVSRAIMPMFLCCALSPRPLSWCRSEELLRPRKQLLLVLIPPSEVDDVQGKPGQAAFFSERAHDSAHGSRGKGRRSSQIIRGGESVLNSEAPHHVLQSSKSSR